MYYVCLVNLISEFLRGTALNFCYFVLHTDERNGPMGRGHRRKIASIKVTDQSDKSTTFVSDNADGEQQTFKVNQEGRYICHLCEKTFKTVSQTVDKPHDVITLVVACF